MLVRALLQTSLVLWLAQETLQGGVKPQSVSWGQVLPARGAGVGVKPGVAGALGALGSRYHNKAMKTGLGRFPGAQLGVGGYRSLGLGGKAALKQGAYGSQGPYGASLGNGMSLGPGLANGLGHSLGQGAKRVYGAGAGTLPGYGALAGMGYPGARPGFGLRFPTGHRTQEQRPGAGPESAGLGQTVQDLRSRASAPSLFGNGDRSVGRDGVLAPELQTPGGGGGGGGGGEVKGHDKPSKSLGPAVSEAQRGESFDPMVLKRKRQQLLPLRTDYDALIQQKQPKNPNCDPSDALEAERRELLGSEMQRKPQLHVGQSAPQTQDKSYLLPLTSSQDFRGQVFSQPAGEHLSDLQVVKDTKGVRIHGTVAVENPGLGSLNVQVQARGSYGPVIPRTNGGQSLGVASVEMQEAKSFAAAERDVKEPKARTDQATRYLGGAGNYMGANLGANGYGAAPSTGLGQGAYLGGAAGKLGAAAALGQGGYPQGAAGKTNGYGEGVTGYLGALAGNGYGDAAKALSTGYGNGYGDGYGPGLGFPADLGDGAESKAGKSKALGQAAYGQVQGPYGLGGGMEANGGKYGGGAQVPYGNAPVIPAGLEGEGGYPYGAQHLGLAADAGKSANKYGAGVGYGAQQTGYGAQLGATQDALGEQPGKYGGMNGAVGNGYKG